MTDRDVVNEFVRQLSRLRGIELSVDSYPELNPDEQYPIDATAGQYAIEHTSIDTAKDQRRFEAWFGKIINPIERDFRGRLPYWLDVTLPYDGIRPGVDWDAIGEALREWLSGTAKFLEPGHHTIELERTPFSISVSVRDSVHPGAYFSRPTPDDSDLSDRLAAQARTKLEKLGPWRSRGYVTILLLESSDLALMNLGKMTDAVVQAFGPLGPPAADEVWYVDTSIPHQALVEQVLPRAVANPLQGSTS